MSELRNPYIQGPAIGLGSFVGREKELRLLRGRIVNSAQPQHCVVIGETGIGRTSLLRTFAREYVPQRQRLLVHLLSVSAGVAGRGSTDDFYCWLFTKLAENLAEYDFAREEASAIADSSLPLAVLEARIQRLFRHIYDDGAGYSQLIVLDGFDHTIKRYDFNSTGWGLLRQFGESPDYGLCYLFGSRFPIDQLEQETGIESNLANIFGGTINLQLFHQSEADLLVDRPMERQGLIWPPPVRELILRLCGGHPRLLQMSCAYLFDQYLENRLDTFMEESQLIFALQEQYGKFFATQKECLLHRELLDVLLKLAHGAPADTTSGQLDRLTNLGYLREDEQDRDRYSPFSPLLDSYLRACGRRAQLWPEVEQVETALRSLVKKRYQQTFGENWLGEVRRVNMEAEASGALNLVEHWQELRQSEQSNVFLRRDAPGELIQYVSVADLKLLIWQHIKLFEDIFPPARREEFERDLDSVAAARSPAARYRRVSQEEAGRVEECSRRLLYVLNTTASVPDTPVLSYSSLLKVGDKIRDGYDRDRYIVVEEPLKSTNHSQVVKARDTELNILVAIKLLRPDPRLSDEQKAALHDLLRREAQIIAPFERKPHPNIGMIRDVLPGNLAIVKPWLEWNGPSFEARVTDPVLAMELMEIVSIGIQLADALDYVHQRKIVHRDIKPSNILFDEEGDPVLIDFDVAHAPEVDTLLTGSRFDELGTQAYSAPEQLARASLASYPADIFALGIVLYQALTHTFPYPYGNDPDLYDGSLPEPEQRDIPTGLYEIIRAMLSEKVGVRPKAGMLRQQLQAYLTTLETGNKA